MIKGINKYGYVNDLDLAKRIIKETFSRWPFLYSDRRSRCIGEETTVKEWLEKVDSSLEAFDGGFSIMREDGYSLGGPDGWSGFVIYEISKWCEIIGNYDLKYDPICTIWDSDEEKFVTFVLHELD